MYLLTHETSYLTKAQRAANYVINNMCTDDILNYENGYEQGIYAAIYAQYMRILIYDCGLSKNLMNKYMTHLQRQMQEAYTNRDQTRGIQKGNFASATSSDEVVESYGASGMPALMLMFPASDTSTSLSTLRDKDYDGPSDVYTPDGQLVMKNATPEQVHQLDSGLYIFQRKKILVR